MSEYSEMILDEYREKLHVYKKLKEVAISELKKLVDSFGIEIDQVNGRIKAEKSLEGKLERKQNKYHNLSEITDIVGVRIVTFYTDDVDKIAASIGSKFIVDWSNSIDKRKIHNLDQFGYMSLHYICKIPKSMYYDESMPEFNDIPFEIQIRTTLQNVWASIQHDIGYKSDIDVPKEYIRRLNRLAGLLELADDEFRNIRFELDEYKRKVKTIVKSGNIDEVELNVDTYMAYIETGVFDKLTKEIASINNMDIVSADMSSFYNVFKAMRFNTLGEIEKMRKDYSDLAYKFAASQFEGKDIDIIASNVGLICLCSVYILSGGFGEVGINILYEKLYGKREINTKLSKKAIETAKKIGIIK